MAVATHKNWEQGFYPNLPYIMQASHNWSSTQLQINAAGEIVATTFQAKVAGNLNAIRFWNAAGGTAGSTANVEIYAADDDGYATGAALASVAAVVVDGSVLGETLATFVSPVAVTRGQRLVLHIEWVSGDIRLLGSLESSRYQGNPTRHFTGSWASESYVLVWEMDIGGTYYTSGWDQTGTGENVSVQRDTADTNPYIGLKFQVPIDMKIGGVRGYWGGTNQNADGRSRGRWILVDSSNVVLTQTPTFGRWDFNSLAQGPHYAMFEDEVSLSKNTTYRLYLEPFNGIYGMHVECYSRATAADLHSMVSVPWDFTESSDEVTWGDDDTLLPLIQLQVTEQPSEEGGGGSCSGYPAEADVRSGTVFGNANEFTGSAEIPAPADVRSGTPVDATNGTAAIPSPNDVRSGIAVDATTGNLVVPGINSVIQGTNYGSNGTEFAGAYVVVSPSNVRFGTTFGPGGIQNGLLHLPAISDVLNGVGYGNNAIEFTGNVILPAENQVINGLAFGSLGALTGNIVIPNPDDVRNGVGFGSLSSLSGVLVLPGEGQVLVAIGFGANGTEFTGNVVLPSPNDVRNGTTFGPGNASSGNIILPLPQEVLIGVTYDSLGSVSGNVVIPGAADVRLGVAFGALAALSGLVAVPGAGDVRLGVAVDQILGNCRVPAPSKVELGFAYDSNDSVIGTLAAGGGGSASHSHCAVIPSR